MGLILKEYQSSFGKNLVTLYLNLLSQINGKLIFRIKELNSYLDVYLG